jgi:hypothetical protein
MFGVFHDLFRFDRVYVGGGNARNLTFKPSARRKRISNPGGILGRFMLWKRPGRVKAH